MTGTPDQSTGAHGSGTSTPQPALPNIPPRMGSPLSGERSPISSSAQHRAASISQLTEDEVTANLRRQWRRQVAHNQAANNATPSSSAVVLPEEDEQQQHTSRPSSTAPIQDSEVPTPSHPADLDSVPISDEQKARIIDRHLALPTGPDASSFSIAQGNDGEQDDHHQSSRPGASHLDLPQSSAFSRHATQSIIELSPDGNEHDEYFSPHRMQGGAITDDIYRWAHQNRRKAARRTRSESVHLPRVNTIDPELDVEGIKEPGGFRRFFLLNQAAKTGQPPPRALRSFIDFLSLYGHFAGEDLEDLDDDDDDEDEDGEEEEDDVESQQRASTSRSLTGTQAGTGQTERSALLTRSRSRRRLGNRSQADGASHQRGEASVTEAVMMLLKSFVGTGILFLGKAFFNGGLLFSSVVLCIVATISLCSFLLLVKANLRVPGSFGDMGGKLYGPKMRLTILTALVFSQLGFVAAYAVFVAQNLQAFVLGVTNGEKMIPTVYFILLQCALFVPLSLIRKIAKLSSTALVADAFILFGIVYLFQYEIRTVLDKGLSSDVKMFNPDSFPLFIGTAVFTFEGVGLVIPITESMKEPERFPKALSGVMIIVMILFTSAGALSYSAFGSKIQTVVITNLPQDSKFVQAMLFLYSIAILLSTPLQLFPALQILERGLFSSKSGKYNTKIKFEKNLFRSAVVLISCLAAWAGSEQLDVFVSFIGAIFCVPLCFLFPPLLSLRALSDRKWWMKAGDYFIIVFGIGAMGFAGSQTIRELFF
ncbi:unnamed protein product [Sympodiomycopsis kandeliae]